MTRDCELCKLVNLKLITMIKRLVGHRNLVNAQKSDLSFEVFFYFAVAENVVTYRIETQN